MNLLMFGPPGAGKGTQSQFLIEQMGMTHISTGDLFRSNIKNETPLGLEAKKYMDNGELVPDAVTIGMVDVVMSTLGDKNFILDGFPRTVAQAGALETLLAKAERKIDKVIFFEVPQADLLGRLTGRRVCKACGEVYHVEARPTSKEGICDKCGGDVVQRDDDKPEAIQTRLNVYEETTKPVKEFYRAKGNLVEVDGTGAAEEVFSRLKEELN